MSDIVESRVPDVGGVIWMHDQLIEWLREHALPLWDRHGVDRVLGGYFESIEFTSGNVLSVTGEVRRGRVAARQIYVFDIGQRLGWQSRFPSPVEHGCEHLLRRFHHGNGLFHTSIRADTWQPVEPFSLYEHAFYLFALARLASSASERHDVRRTALRCLEQLRDRWGKADGGFEEAVPPTLPLKSNPHMHLLEAALAWIETSEGEARQPWVTLAEELVSLCLNRFADVRTGAVREYFDHEWRPVHGDAGRIVEPGHQFEWAWLLFEWAALGHADVQIRQVCTDAALRFMEVGEQWGVDPVRGVAMNEIWDDLGVKDANAKLWPQTERLKAWCARLTMARSVDERKSACLKIVAAARGLLRYLRVEPAGLWHEVWSADGSFSAGPSKASSLYHVVCAIDVLQRTVAKHPLLRAYAASSPSAVQADLR